jgi:PAS domain S-box-containing protein
MDTPLLPTLLQEVTFAFGQIEHLPMNIFASRPDGRVVLANKRARSFFNMQGNLDDFDIAACYEDKGEREHIVEFLKNAAPGVWVENLRAKLNINGKHAWVRYASLPFFDAGNQLQFMLNLTESVSEFEWFSDFANDMKAGFFEVDKNLNLTSCNQFIADILGYNSPEKMIGQPVGNFLWGNEAAGKIMQDIMQTPEIRDRHLRLLRSDGGMVIAKMACSATSWENGRISRVKGIIRDITFETLHHDLPVGLFLINDSPNGEIYGQVNDTFARIHGFPSAADVIGEPADVESASAVTYAAYRLELEKAAANNQALLDYGMEILDKNGERRNVVVNARYVEGSEGKIRVGAVYDLTNHVGRNRRVLEANFSAVLHTYLATVNGLRDTLLKMSQAHGHDFLKQGRSIDRAAAMQEVARHRRRFDVLLEQLRQAFEDRNLDKSPYLSIEKAWLNINRPRVEFDNKEKDNASWMRRNLIEVNKHLRQLRDLHLRRELTKDMRAELDEMLRLTSIVSISISIDELNERIPDFNYFRDYLLRGETTENEAFGVQNLMQILTSQVQKLEEFASSRSVEMVLHFNPLKDIVPVQCRADLSRAFYSLVNNAVKYSWSKTQERQAHVDIYLERKKDEIDIIIENWGVAIRKEELENEAIMQFGRRGKEADDRGRSGTGIGLFDAREIILQHSGKLRLTSEPTLGNPADAYQHPFITRAYITLPISKPA